MKFTKMPFSDAQDFCKYFACCNASESLRLARIFATDGPDRQSRNQIELAARERKDHKEKTT
jgi:hypothetical protein